jgi:hypothetical protein
MTTDALGVSFYGSYMNLEVLRDIGIAVSGCEVARLDGFDIAIAPLANLVRADHASVHGVLAYATPEDLDRLYAHARDILGGTYRPESVSVQTRDGRARVVRCYIAPHMDMRPADRAYVERILQPARAWGFPAWYISRLEHFRPDAS